MRHDTSSTFLAGTKAAMKGVPPRRRRLLALTTAALVAPALLTACGSDTPAKTSSGLTVVTVGSGGNIFDMPLRVADANGYFKKQGLQVKFATLTAATGPSSLQSGSVQFLNDSPTGFVAALSKKLPEIAVSADGSGNPLGLAVSKKFAQEHNLTADSPAATVAKALKGSTGGASSANTKAEAGIFLKNQGVDSSQVKWVSLPSPAADKAALKSNQIDWFVTSEPIPLQIQSDGDGVVVVDSTKAPEWSAEQAGYGQLVVTQKSYATGHADIVRKFVAAVQQGTAYLNSHLGADNDKTVLAVARKALPGVPDDVLRSSLQQVDWPTTGTMKASDWVKTQAFVESIGALPDGTELTADDWTNKYLP